MRASLLFSVRWFAPVLVLAAVCWMLAVPCLPLSDPAGQPMAVPRWEFWLIVASVPSTIAWQWTGSLDAIVWTDRLPIFAWTCGWIFASWLAGWPVLRMDPYRRNSGRIESCLLSILAGYPILGFVCFAHGSIIGLDRQRPLLWMSLPASVIVVTVLLWLKRHRAEPDSVPGSIETAPVQTPTSLDKAQPQHDPSFQCAMFRRLVGLLVLGLIWLGGIQMYGSTIPSQDHEVRETAWWLAKHSIDDRFIRLRYDNLVSNGPCLESMPIVATTYLHACITSPRTSDVDAIEHRHTHDQTRLLASRQLGALTGKAIQSSLGLIGLSLLGLHLTRYFGMLPALLACFLILATPGISELVRLGRAEYLVGVWLTAWTIRFIERRANGIESPNFVGWFLLAGACSLSYASLILIAVPAMGISLWEWRSQGQSPRWTTKETVVLLFAVLIGSAVPMRNALATGDPFFPWGTVLFEASQGTRSEAGQQQTTGSLLRDAYRIPAETIAEQMQSAQREIDGDSNASAELPARLLSSPFRIANAIDGVSRLLWNSTAHGLLLIPLAIVGVCVWRHHLRGRIVLLPCVWFLGWCIAWWGFTPRWDRDWVGMLILLAWPAAQGVRWFMDRVHAMWLGVMGVVVLCWSVLVIPVWPMSDNRLLVAIEEIRSDDLRGATASARDPKAGNGPDDVATDQTESSYVKALNGYLGSLRGASEVNVLIVGELDDFDIIAKTITSDRFDSLAHGNVSEMDSQHCGRYLSERSVSHVVIVWSGVLAREKLTNVAKEQKYRRLIDELTVAGRLRRVDWEMNSSVAELFEVNNQ